MKILLLGARGMLGQQLLLLLRAAGHQVTSSDRSSGDTVCDLVDKNAVMALVSKVEPEFIINCAAYTAVDKAESESVAAFSVNAFAARNIAVAAKNSGARLIHISTDYIYGGVRPHVPVVEGDKEEPCGVYGLSKYLGDELIQCLHGDKSMILRSSWLHGLYGPNFVHTIKRLAEERTELKVVDDQMGSPTWAGWLARSIVRSLDRFQPGIFHAANRGGISWFEFAQAICKRSGSSCRVLPQSSQELARPAPRPSYSVLNCSKFEALLGEPCQSWEEGLDEHLELLKNEPKS